MRMKKTRRTKTTNSGLLSKSLLPLLLVAACLSSLSAQSKDKKNPDAGTRSVQGLVQDADEKPVTGAVVQLKDMRTLQIRSFVTQDDGMYHFNGLKTEVDYQVKAIFNNMSSAAKTVSLFDTRKMATLNLKLEKEPEKK
jgi:hypothetical protein